MVRKDATGKASESLQLLSEASLASLDSFSNSTEDSVKDSGLLSVVSSWLSESVMQVVILDSWWKEEEEGESLRKMGISKDFVVF